MMDESDTYKIKKVKKGVTQVLKLMLGDRVSELYRDTMGPYDEVEAVRIKINGFAYDFRFDTATSLVINGMDADAVIKHSVRSAASELAMLLADSVTNGKG